MNLLCYFSDESYFVLENWPEDIDYNFLKNLMYGSTHIISKIELIDNSGRIISIHQPYSLFSWAILIDEMYKNDRINYNMFKIIPKEFIKIYLPEYLSLTCVSKNTKYRIVYILDNLDKIYDEMMIKDIIE